MRGRGHSKTPNQTDDSPGLASPALCAADGAPEVTGARSLGQLNDSQRRRLSITCRYIDRLLADIEQILDSAASESPFPRYILDVEPEQALMVEECIRRLRVELLRALEWQQMAPKPPEIPATRAVLTNLHFIDIAIEELRPRYLKGSGAVPEDAVEGLDAVIRSLRVLANDMVRSLLRDPDAKEDGSGSGKGL